MKDNFDVIIIGGGAAGLMCAAYLFSQKKDLNICIFEKNDRVGKKLLSTGNGRCNYENLNACSKDYYSDDSSRIDEILSEFNVNRIIDFFEDELGVISDNIENLVYPITYKSSTILDSLRFYTKIVTVINSAVTSIKNENGNYVVNGDYSSSRIVFSCGGAAAPATGSDGNLFAQINNIAGKNSFTKIYPALVPLKSSDSDIKPLSGQRIKCKATLSDRTEEGELLFTDYGVSGIMVMQLSRYYYELLANGKTVNYIELDLLPKFSLDEKVKVIDKLFNNFPERTKVQALTGLLNRQLAEVVLKRSGNTSKDIAGNINSFKINITGTMGFENSQVTRGGLKLSYLNDSLEFVNSPNCFACGELLNVDGPCGGYNLNWAWASAMKVADSIIKGFDA